jgi:hypothetical protein
MSNPEPRFVHLVGSVPLESAEQVFRAAGGILGDRLRRIPDGETGERSNWILWQIERLLQVPEIERAPAEGAPRGFTPLLRLKPGADPAAVRFGPLGFAEVARASYALFSRLRREGAVPAGCRFQVCLPTPLAPPYCYLPPGDREAVEPAYEARLLEEVHEIVATIPPEDLAIQWDTAVEFALLEHTWLEPMREPPEGILRRLCRIGDWIPPEIDVGYHLCYGDAGHKHFVEPKDAAQLVSVANAISAGVRRRVSWIHLPIPKDRADDGYYAPLRDLRLHPETELYLGLVHLTDGVEGARRRIAAAQRAAPRFGVATECGFGRRPPEIIPDLLRLHAEVAAELA